ncbi:disease resistance protein [Striga asiatica]|uniref:Disease resistance protein n=1 Tax=Striga asiatica TaxID=4170 RepID=A0A5A7QPB1_STRAF|nr:disease resistance protein [Striga asiatica]
MGWIIRHNVNENPLEFLCPNYSSGSQFFTIRMYHSGKFVKYGTRYYVGENMRVSHIDFCDPDEMSFLEIINITRDLGLKECKKFHVSTNGIDNCSSLFEIQNDSDALNLVNFLDENRVVGIYIEHQNSTLSTIASEPRNDYLPICRKKGHNARGFPLVKERRDISSGLDIPPLNEEIQTLPRKGSKWNSSGLTSFEQPEKVSRNMQKQNKTHGVRKKLQVSKNQMEVKHKDQQIELMSNLEDQNLHAYGDS